MYYSYVIYSMPTTVLRENNATNRQLVLYKFHYRSSQLHVYVRTTSYSLCSCFQLFIVLANVASNFYLFLFVCNFQLQIPILFLSGHAIHLLSCMCVYWRLYSIAMQQASVLMPVVVASHCHVRCYVSRPWNCNASLWQPSLWQGQVNDWITSYCYWVSNKFVIIN